MFQVFRIRIRCPNTGKSVDTGLQTTSKEEFETGVYMNQEVSCPNCGETHSWRKEDAYLQIDDSRSADPYLWRPNRYRSRV